MKSQKRLLLRPMLLAGLYSFVFPVFSATNDVSLSCPAGVQHLSIAPHETLLVALPFKPYDPSIAAVLNASGIRLMFKWDSKAARYITFERPENGDWIKDFQYAKDFFSAGEAFVILNKAEDQKDLYLCGEVVLDTETSVMLDPSLNVVGSPYAAQIDFQENTRKVPDGVILSEGGKSMEPGRGYWVDNTNGTLTEWHLRCPYSGVFSSNSTLPRICGIRVEYGDSGLSQVMLSLACSGGEGETLDVLYLDIPESTNSVNLTRNWKIAEQGIVTGGRTVVEWIDKGDHDRLPISDVVTRLYLVGVSGIAGDRNEDVIADEAINSAQGPAEHFGGGQTNEDVTLAEPLTGVKSSKVIYVDQAIGDDAFSGLASQLDNADGPKKTIKGAGVIVQDGDTVIIRSGIYNERLNFAGKNIQVRIQGYVRLIKPAP